ncbi:MAG: rhomboid family intramembrane serine protease [Rikenellaceae bacterium]
MINKLNQMSPPVVLNLIIINCLALMATTIFPIIYHYLALFDVTSPAFKLYQVVTYMFLHGDLSHLFFNMFALWMFGRNLEYELGSKRFLTYYMACGVGAGLIQLAVGFLSPFSITVGASGAVFGILLAFGLMHPNARIMLLIPPIPMKAKWFVILYGLLELFLGVRGGAMDNVAHFAHLGGMIWGFLLLTYWKYKGEIRY